MEHAVEHNCDDNCFKLRRVDEVQHLIWDIIPKMKLYDIAHRSKEDRLSVLIVGFGQYGIEFFKTLLWYFQFEGYTLEITIIDNKGTNENDYISKKSIVISRMYSNSTAVKPRGKQNTIL